MKNIKRIVFLVVAAAAAFVMFNTEKDYPAGTTFYTGNADVQIVVSENGDTFAAFVGWDENEDYTNRAIKLVDKNSTQVKELKLPDKIRDSYSGFFIGEKYVVAYTNQLYGVGRDGKLFNLDIYSYDGKLVKSDNFTSLDRDEYIDDAFLRRANLYYHFEWMDSDNLLMYGPLAIYRVNIPDGTVNKVTGVEELIDDWNCEKYMDTAASRLPGQDTFLYGIIPFRDGHNEENGIVFRLYDKMELNNTSYRIMQWKDGVGTPLTDYMTQNEIYYDSATGIMTDVSADVQNGSIALCPGYKVVLLDAGGNYMLEIRPEN